VKADLSVWSAIAPPETVKKLKKAGIERPLDLLLFFPASYRGASAVYSKAGKKELTSVDARMESVTLAGTGRQHILCKAKSAEDGSPIEIRYFNYNTGMQARLARMRDVTITGDPAAREGLTEFVHPRVVPKGSSYGGSPAPQYPAVRGVKAAEIRKMIASALESYDLQDTVPGEVLDKLKLPTFREALTEHHRPKDDSVEQILDGSRRSARCGVCCTATSGPARRSSPAWPAQSRRTAGTWPPSWHRRSCWRSSTAARWRPSSSRAGSVAS